MAAVSISQMLAAEAAALANGWTEEQLLDLAGTRLGHAIGRHFPNSGTVIGYLGKGHNAGDTLVALKILRDQFHWNVAARIAVSIEQFSPLARRKWDELGLGSPLSDPPHSSVCAHPILLLDGLLGTGSQGAMRSPLLALAAEMEQLRNPAGALVASVDLPSGIDPDTGIPTPGTVTADVTFMIGNAKRGLLTAQAANSTGALALVPMEPLCSDTEADIELISPQTMNFAKSRRAFDFHKGTAGRISIIAGSESYTGAAVLAALGALRGGGGLITLHTPSSAVAAISSRCPPEIIVRGFTSIRELLPLTADSLVIGCGLGDLPPADAQDLIEIIKTTTIPTVIDADALNLIAKSGNLGILGNHHVITPHPGEFKRLAPDLAELPRESATREFVNRIPCTLLLKGCRTLVTQAGHPLWCNSTGSPGMATGGQGDLLAGVLAARLASSLPPLQAAAHAAWLCGRAAEICLNQPGISEESLTPTDVASHLGQAFSDWRNSRR